MKPDVLSILIGVNDYWHTLDWGYKGTVEVYDKDLRALLDRTIKKLPNVKLIIGEPFAVEGGSAIQVRSICNGGDRSSFSTKDTFTTEQAGGGGGTSGECDGDFFLGLSIILDDFGSETEYELVDEYGDVIASGGPFQDGNNGQEVEDDFCLEDGCYYIAVYDSYGDGICCEYGNGHFEIFDEAGNVLAESDGYFGFVEYIDFCVEDGDFEYIGFRRPTNQNRVAGDKKKTSGQ